MLRYFRINDPYRLLSLLAVMILAGLPVLIDQPLVTLQELRDMLLGEKVGYHLLYADLLDRTPPLMALADELLSFLFSRSLLARHGLALLILFFQAAYFAILLINNRAYNENTYLPSLIFGLLCFFSFDLLALTPEVLASTIMLLALNNIFKEIEFRVDKDSIVLNLGVYIGLASLFVLTYAIFLPGAIVLLIVFARTSIRKILLVLVGFFLVHGILLTFYYYHNETGALWSNFYLANLEQARRLDVSLLTLAYLGIVPALYFLISLFMLTREARFTRYQTQIFQVLFIWLLLAAVEAWLEPGIAPHSFITLVPPLAYFISHYLLLIRRRKIAEFMLWLFLAGILTGNYATRHGWVEGIDYSGLFPAPSVYREKVQGKKVMVIGNDPGLYEHNFLGGGFLDWELSRIYFEQPDYYEHIIRIDRAFTADPPEVIIDARNLMPAVLDRLPAVAMEYKQEGALYWRK